MASSDSSVDSCGCSVSSGRSTCCGRCALWHSSSISASEQMMVALPSWIRRLQPVLCGMVMSPGTANRLRLSSFAQPAVLSAPERARACATIRVDDNAAIRRLRSRNRLASGTVPGHSSEIKAPEWLSICSNRFWLLFGPIWFSPPANTATVRPASAALILSMALTAPQCAAASVPSAPPDTTRCPARAIRRANSWALRLP